MARRPSLTKIVEKLRAIPSLVALEALWDGDTGGWYIVLSAISESGESHWISQLSRGSDFRLFSGEVPPWPEAEMVKEIHRRISVERPVELWFPSPDRPEDDCPSYRDRARATPCAGCGIPLLQADRCPWKGICYHCHLERERAGKA
jgi:hypothetical protein